MSVMERSGVSATPSIGVTRKVQIGILATDALALVVATLIGFVTRFSVGELDTGLTGPIQVVGTIAPLFWIALLVVLGSYEQRVVGLGLTEYGRILKSGLWMVAIVSMVSFLGKFDTSRAYVLLVIPIGLAGLLVERWLWRRWILQRRKKGRELQTTIVIGEEQDAAHVHVAFEDRPWAGYRVVASQPGPSSGDLNTWLDHLMAKVAERDISCIALTGSCGLSGSDVRELSWRIEGRGIDLLLSSALGAVTGPRMSLRVATGLPFVHLDEVGLSLSQRTMKRLIDFACSVVAIVLLSPVLIVIAMAVVLSSGLPILFSQPRAGLRGNLFRMWKFRTMRPEADALKEQLRQQADLDSPMVKIPNDPRITPIGKFLRGWSLDELPQLLNVLGGNMSLVGPRPHPMDDIRRYRESDSRRLLAKPGMTGLWQVAGRSDLTWEDAVELDLLYIENWSVLGDITILARTVQAVFARGGAY